MARGDYTRERCGAGDQRAVVEVGEFAAAQDDGTVLGFLAAVSGGPADGDK